MMGVIINNSSSITRSIALRRKGRCISSSMIRTFQHQHASSGGPSSVMGALMTRRPMAYSTTTSAASRMKLPQPASITTNSASASSSSRQALSPPSSHPRRIRVVNAHQLRTVTNLASTSRRPANNVGVIGAAAASTAANDHTYDTWRQQVSAWGGVAAYLAAGAAAAAVAAVSASSNSNDDDDDDARITNRAVNEGPSLLDRLLLNSSVTHCDSASAAVYNHGGTTNNNGMQGPASTSSTSSAPMGLNSPPGSSTSGGAGGGGSPVKARNVMIHRMRSVRGRELDDKYIVDWKTVLGEGAYGSVHPARLRATGEKVALKKISRKYTNSSTFKTETDALLRIYDNGGHPNISGLRDMYEDHHHYYLILDLVTGGEMFEHLINYGAYSEADAARLMHEIASALAFLHGVGVVHADLKPENLLLSTKNRLDGTIKMIDFGAAVVQDDLEDLGDFGIFGSRGKKAKMKSAASTGTTAYWPPERFKKGIVATSAMDMWSIGVVLYIMLTGVHPFDVQGISTDKEIEERIRKDPRPPLNDSLVGHLSDSAIDLIIRLMEPDPKKRISAYQMLQHPWVRGETALTEKIPDSDTKLSRFKDLRYKLEAGMFAVMVSQSNKDAKLSEARTKTKMSEREDASTHILQRAFQVFDAEGKGFVTADDLGRVTNERLGSHISSNDTKEFLATQSGGLESASALSLSQFNKLFSGLRQKHFPRGHYIFHAGDKGDAMYFICSGKVEIQTRKGQLVSILRSGDFFGEGSLVEAENSRYTTAKTATPVDVIEISRQELDRFLGASPHTKNELRAKWRARTLTYAKNLLRLQKNVQERVYKKGDVIYKEGDIGSAMFRVHDVDGGVLDVTHNGVLVHKYMEGDSFGESSLLFKRPRSSTVTCASDECHLHVMKGRDFLAAVETSPELASSLRNMCRKRLFKKAVKLYSLDRTRGLTKEDIVAAFHDADVDRSGFLNLDEVRRLMHRMDPSFPMEEIRELLKFVDVDEDGNISLEEFKNLFRQFEEDEE